MHNSFYENKLLFIEIIKQKLQSKQYNNLLEKLLVIPQVKYHFSKIPQIKKILTFRFKL